MNDKQEVEVASPIPVATFEGALVTEMEGRLPAISMEMPEGYAHGTHLRLEIEVRVKNVRYEETRKGDLVRQHVFALESVSLKSAFNPDEVVDTIGGSSTPNRSQTDREAEELGIRIGRSSDMWGSGSVVAEQIPGQVTIHEAIDEEVG